MRPNCHKKVLSYHRAGIEPRRGAPKTPLCEMEGTQGPWRRGATACCRLLRQLLLRYGWTVARVGPFVIFVSLLVKRTVELTVCPVCVPKVLDEYVTKFHMR